MCDAIDTPFTENELFICDRLLLWPHSIVQDTKSGDREGEDRVRKYPAVLTSRPVKRHDLSTADTN